MRHQARLNQTDFGVKIGRSKGTITDWERGVNEPDRDSIDAILAAFQGAEPPPFRSKNGRPPDALGTAPPLQPMGRTSTDEGKTLAAELDAISDPTLRHKALRKAMKAIDEVLEDPSMTTAEETAHRGRRS